MLSIVFLRWYVAPKMKNSSVDQFNKYDARSQRCTPWCEHAFVLGGALSATVTHI